MSSEMLNRMKQRLQERKKSFEQDTSIFPFWNMDYNETTIARLAPYDDAMSGGFWAEKKVIPMKFVDPEDASKIIQYKAPCLEMYVRDVKCPILKYVRDLYSEAKSAQQSGDTDSATSLKSIANAHWLSNTMYYQGFIRKTPIKEENVPENILRVLPFTKKIHGWVMSSVMENTEDPFERLPTGEFTVEDIHALNAGEVTGADLAALTKRLEGRNMLLKKVKQGEYADWTTGTQWHSQWSDLLPEEIECIERFGLHDLSKRLPERPSPEQYSVLEEMIRESIARMMGESEGVWNPEWEEAGIKPFRARNNDEKKEEKTFRKPVAKNDETPSGDASDETPANPSVSAASVMEKVALSRGAKPAVAAPAPEDEKSEEVATPTATATPARKVPSSVIDKVNARRAAAAAAKAAA